MKKLITLLLTFFGVTAANAQCNHTLTMIDSWGDGWNGASVDVNVNGVAVLSGVSCTAASTDETFTASTGDAILLANWFSGSYDGEISWELKDGSGTIIQSGVWGDATGGAGACPSCNPPNTLAVANVTTTTADFSWVAGGSETAWNVEYGAAGFTQGTGTSVPVTAASYSMTGLTANTAYDVYVQADCGAAQSVFAGPTSFTTPCATVSSPYDEPFSASLPSCWTMSGGEDWLFTDTYIGFGNGHAGNAGVMNGSTTSGAHFAGVDASGHSGTATLSSPTIDVSTLSSAQLSFFLISDNEGTAYNSTLSVFCNSDSLVSYTGNTPGGWEQKFVDLSAYTGTVQIHFVFSEDAATGAYFDDLAIDDVSVGEAPSCSQPSGLTASNVTDVSADLTWTAGGSETAWNIEYGAAGFTQGTGTVVGATATTYSFTGLTPSTYMS